MASALLRFRRGTTANKSGSLAYGEPYVNISTNTLQVGGLSSDWNIPILDSSNAGSFEVTGDLTVGGKLTAQEFDTVYVSSSIIYSSGSTKFGDSQDDTHQFTGSVSITGSQLYLSGDLIVDGTITGGGIDAAFSSSVESRITLLESTASDHETRIDSLEISVPDNTNRIINLESSASLLHDTIGLKFLTNFEVSQLQNIDSSSISVQQWQYLGTLNQSLSSSASPQFSALTVNNDIIAYGDIYARSFNVEVTQSSILYQSGSTKFGDSMDDTHQFTGSVAITGSQHTIRGSVTWTEGALANTERVEFTTNEGPLVIGYNDWTDLEGDYILSWGDTYTGQVFGFIQDAFSKFQHKNGTRTSEINHVPNGIIISSYDGGGEGPQTGIITDIWHVTNYTGTLNTGNTGVYWNYNSQSQGLIYDDSTASGSGFISSSLITKLFTENHFVSQSHTGDVTIVGEVSASLFSGSFVGDGSGLTGVIAVSASYVPTLQEVTTQGNQTTDNIGITGSLGVRATVSSDGIPLLVQKTYSGTDYTAWFYDANQDTKINIGTFSGSNANSLIIGHKFASGINTDYGYFGVHGHEHTIQAYWEGRASIGDSLSGYVPPNKLTIYTNVATEDSYTQFISAGTNTGSDSGVSVGMSGSLEGVLINYESQDLILGAYGSEKLRISNTDITSNVNVIITGSLIVTGSISLSTSGSITDVAHIDFWNTNGDPAHQEGRLFYDSTDKALTYMNDATDVKIQIGQEMVVRGRNATGTTISNGAPVRFSGSLAQRPQLITASADIHGPGDFEEDHIIGLATHDITDNTDGFVTTFGIVRDIDTSGYAEGDIIYVSSSGGELTNSRPLPPYDIIKVGTVINSHATQGAIFVHPQDAMHLHDISKISGSDNPSDGEVLVYDGVNQWWYPTKTGLSLTGSFSGSVSTTLQEVTDNGNITTTAITSSDIYVSQSNLYLDIANRLYFDGPAGSGDTYLTSLVDNTLIVYISGSTEYQFNGSAFLPSVDIANNVGQPANRWLNLYTQNISTGINDGDTVVLRAWNTASLAFKSFITLTAGDEPTLAIDNSGGPVTINATSITGSFSGSVSTTLQEVTDNGAVTNNTIVTTAANFRAASPSYGLFLASSGNPNTGVFRGFDQYKPYIATSGSKVMTFTTSSIDVSTDVITTNDIIISGSGYLRFGDSDTYVYESADDSLRFYAGGNEMLLMQGVTNELFVQTPSIAPTNDTTNLGNNSDTRRWNNLYMTGSIYLNDTASKMYGTASWADNAVTASYVPTLQEVTDNGYTTTNPIEISGSNTYLTIAPTNLAPGILNLESKDTSLGSLQDLGQINFVSNGAVTGNAGQIYVETIPGNFGSRFRMVFNTIDLTTDTHMILYNGVTIPTGSLDVTQGNATISSGELRVLGGSVTASNDIILDGVLYLSSSKQPRITATSDEVIAVNGATYGFSFDTGYLNGGTGQQGAYIAIGGNLSDQAYAFRGDTDTGYGKYTTSDDGLSAIFSDGTRIATFHSSGVDITGSLIVTGKVTAQEFHTEFVSSSIIYSSGSTKFGDSQDDVHSFTGSVSISGSLDIDIVSSAAVYNRLYYQNNDLYLVRKAGANHAYHIEHSNGTEGVRLDYNATNNVSALIDKADGTWLSFNGDTDVTTLGLNGGTTNLRSNINIGDAISQTHTITGSLNITGSQITLTSNDIQVTGSLIISSSTSPALTIYGSGSTLFSVEGSVGTLLSINDGLSGSLFSVNNISGLPILEVFSNDDIVMGSSVAKSLYTTEKTIANSGSTVIHSHATSSYTSMFYDYTISSGSNARAGTIQSVWLGSTIEYNETTTMDIGNTSVFTASVALNGANVELSADTPTNSWTVKTIVRGV